MSLLLHQFRAEQRLFWRSRELAFFTFLLPIVFFLILGSAYGDEEIEGADGYLYLLSGMIGYGAAATAFAGLALLLVIRRESGVLKRLRATPLPGWAYITAVLGSIVFVFFLEAIALVVLGRLAFDVALPDNAVSLVAALALGAVSFAALGVGLTALITQRRGLVGGRERDLPPARLHLGLVLLVGRLSGRSSARSRRRYRLSTSSASSAT